MNKSIIFIIIIIIIIIAGIFVSSNKIPDGKLIGPNFQSILRGPVKTPVPQQTPILSPTPRTFNFDSSTDLRGELETINPQVLESDFDI